jgi:hypothetical protein
MSTSASAFVGRWRITEMETWDADYCDMEVPAHITVHQDLSGELQFGLVRGELDGRVLTSDGKARLEFSWAGFDENDPAGGRGWLQANGDVAEGYIVFDAGDDSTLTAIRRK